MIMEVKTRDVEIYLQNQLTEKKMELSRYEIVDVEVVSPPKVEKVHWDYVLKEVVGESS